MGNYNGALAIHKHDLDIRLKVLGKKDTNTAESYDIIGLVKKSKG